MDLILFLIDFLFNIIESVALNNIRKYINNYLDINLGILLALYLFLAYS
jgi:hypothetical protein